MAKWLNCFIVILLICSLLTPTIARADDLSDYQERLQEIQEKQKEYEEKIAELQAKERTLKNEIAYMDNQIYLTTLRIEETQTKLDAKIGELNQLIVDIGELEKRLERLGEGLLHQQGVYQARVREVYKSSRISSVEIIFGSENLTALLRRIKYLKVLEAADRRLMKQMELTKANYEEQKKLLEEKKVEVEEVKAAIEREKKNLEGRKNDLARQKKEKEYILAQTRNDEETYQRLLEQIRAELESIARALTGGVKIGPVKRGDLIAVEGNTGCCCSWNYGCNPPPAEDPTAGSHLHFGVYKDGVAMNPEPYLDSGELSWPEEGTMITQRFGENYNFYMRNFGVPGHNGLDMTGGFGAPIYAAADGEAYSVGDVEQYASWCNGAANGVRVDHGDGLVTIYWHVQ